MLETTQYNYKEASKYYKELMNSGLSKFMPMVSLGHAQSSVYNLAHFENDILDLPAMMIPPLMSSTMSGEDILGIKGKSNSSNSQNTSEGEVGRPEKPDDQKSEKTIQNKESMS
jgi:hypothetical protein